jgi:hypothetical protein
VKRRAFTLCEETGAAAVDGACPSHGGDACLREYLPAPRVRQAWAAAERVTDWLEAVERSVTDGAVIAVPVSPTDLEQLVDVADHACACGEAHFCAAEVRAAVAAARVLLEEHHLADWVTVVRDREMQGWTAPR